MRVGVGLPVSIMGTAPETILDWARRADAGPFSSVSTNDRLLYGNYEALSTLAVVAGATSKVRLITGVLLSPTRNATVLAKQAATIDALSGGRLTLGLGVGMRQDDFQAVGASHSDRGARFETQLTTMKRIWAGEPVAEGLGSMGPPPARAGGPELLIGARTAKAIRRVGKWADGFIAAGSPPDVARQNYEIALDAWKQQGRDGEPRFLAGGYFALGDNASEKGSAWVHDYYGFAPPMADAIAGAILTTPDAIRGAVKAFEAVGVDEMVFSATIGDVDQIDRLAEALG